MRPFPCRSPRPRALAGLLGVVALAGCGRAMRPAAAPQPERAGSGVSAADVAFVQGMIEHHAQAVLMAGWAPTHDAGRAVQELCRRIAVSQRDEIAAMSRWLRERGQAVPDVDTATGRTMAGMGGAGMGADTLMPGMLTAAQLAELDAGQGREFDRRFLRFMIQHHQGALAMVQQLVSSPGAAQDGFVFQFASGVNADQSAEIDRMRRMLAALTIGEGNP